LSIIDADPGLMIAGSSRSSDGHLTENFGGSDFWVLQLEEVEAVNEMGVHNTRIYPNPVKDGRIYVHSSGPCFLELISVSGTVVLSVEISDSDQSIPLGSLYSGIYFARFVSSNGIQIEKILIE